MSPGLDERTELARAALRDLVARQATRGLVLGDLAIRIELAIDFSVSMERRFVSGEVQSLVERVLALNLAGFARDDQVTVRFFSDDPYPPEIVDRDNFLGFTDRWRARYEMRGTRYARTIEAIMPSALPRRRWFRRPRPGADLIAEREAPPCLALIVTDGQPTDRDRVRELIAGAATRPYFWQFVGLGVAPGFLFELDGLTGRPVDNLSVVRLEDTLAMDDAEFFDAIVRQFLGRWLPEARRLGITRR